MYKLVKTLSLLTMVLFGLGLLRISGSANTLEGSIVNFISKNIFQSRSSLLPQPISNLIVVDISDSDYDKTFKGRSPLDQQKLHLLIDAIAKNNPRLIAVDIDTSDQSFRDFKIDKKWPLLIWERDILIGQQERASSTNSRAIADAQENEIVPLDVLAGRDPLKLNIRSGIPELRDDSADGVTRFYTRCVATAAGSVPSFVKAVAAEGQSDQMKCEDDADTKLLYYITYSNIYGSEKNIAAEAVLNDELPEHQLDGKIVLLGGSYRDFDRHLTPLGTKTGVEILANAIQTERGRVRIPVLLSIFPEGVLGWIFTPLFRLIVIDLLIGIIILYMIKHQINLKIKRVGIIFVFLILMTWLFSEYLIGWLEELIDERNLPPIVLKLFVIWPISFVYFIAPALVAVIVVVVTEYLRDEMIETWTEAKARNRYAVVLVVTTEFVRRIFIGRYPGSNAPKR